MGSTTSPTSVHDLRTLVRSRHPLILVETVEEERMQLLLESVAAQERLPLFHWTVTRGLTRADQADQPHRLTASPAALLQHIAALKPEAIFWLKDLHPHLNEPALVRHFRDVCEQFSRTRSTVVLTGEPVRVSPELEKLAVRFDLQPPDRAELEAVIRSARQSLGRSLKAGAVAPSEDQDRILRALQGLTLHQARQVVSQCLIEDGRFTAADVERILSRKAQVIREGGLLEYYPAADNRFELGGFATLKAWLDRARLGFSPEARALNLAPPRGILLVGVPGCGKSLAAKAIARSWELPLLKLDAGRLFDKYIGESERNFRKATALAESLAPIVLWIDEIEKAIVAGGSGDADAGLSRRLFGAFLTWLQEKKQDVFVVATANDLSALPPELLRKGRFDEVFFVDLPDPVERRTIWEIHLKLRKQDPAGIDLAAVIAASDGFSGAEIEQAVVAGLYRALHAGCRLDTGLLLTELGQTVPLSRARREDIAALRRSAQDRFVSVA